MCVKMSGTLGDVDIMVPLRHDPTQETVVAYFVPLAHLHNAGREFEGEDGVEVRWENEPLWDRHTFSNVPDWLVNGWSELPPNVFIDYWLERDDLPASLRELLEAIQW